MSRSMPPTPQHNGMVQSWPGNPGVTDPFLAPSASPGSRRQVSVPIPFREAEVEHSPMPTPMRIVCTTYSPSSRSPVLNSCRLKTTRQLNFRGKKNYRFDPTWTSLPKARPAEDHLGSKESTQSFQRTAWVGPQSRNVVNRDGRAGAPSSRKTVRLALCPCGRGGHPPWLFVLANKVAIHLLRLLQPHANPAPAEVFGTWQPSLRQHSDLAAMG